MCCLFTVLAILGPRVAILFWWLADPGRWDRAFDTWFWPLLGFIILPWTLLMYVAVRPGGFGGFDWIWIAFAVLADLSMYAGGGYGNRDRMPAYASRTST